LNAVVRNVLELVRPELYDAGIELQMDLDRHLQAVSGVELHLEQVLLNLLRNAKEAIQGWSNSQKFIRIRSACENGSVRITVQDGGPGIDKASVVQLFDQMYTTKATGMGVGLRISRGLIENHNGHLWIEPNTPGAIVHFEVPVI
jgi:two-component system CheB/CheR fusion protein